MSWGSEFVKALESPGGAVAFAVRVEPLELGNGPGITGYWLASAVLDAWPHADPDAFIVTDSVQSTMASVNPVTWTPTTGGYTFRVAGVNMRGPAAALKRGSILGLYVAVGVAPVISTERVHLGMVTAVEGYRQGGPGPGYDSIAVTVMDITCALGGRLGAALGDRQLFGTVGSTAVLTVTEAVASTTYDVDDASAFGIPTSGVGAIYVEPTGALPYWRLVSAKTGTTLTISTPATASRMGTTDVGAASGSTVTEAWYASGHPFDVTRKLLCSTGAGTNGAYDTLVSSWGLGVPVSFVDDDDIDLWRDQLLQPATGSYTWELAGTTPVDDAYSWLSSLLSAAGMWISVRQGRLTLRAVQSSTLDLVGVQATLAPADLSTVEGIHWYDPAQSREYENAQVYANGTNAYSTSGSVVTYPSEVNRLYDLSAYTYTNLSAVTTAEAARFREAAVSIWMRVEVVLAGLRCAGLCRGDLVALAWPDVPSRWDWDGGLDGYTAHVLGVMVNWTAGTVTLSLGVPPKYGDAG